MSLYTHICIRMVCTHLQNLTFNTKNRKTLLKKSSCIVILFKHGMLFSWVYLLHQHTVFSWSELCATSPPSSVSFAQLSSSSEIQELAQIEEDYVVDLKILILLTNPGRVSHDGVSACKQDYFPRQEIYIHKSIKCQYRGFKVNLLKVIIFQSLCDKQN